MTLMQLFSSLFFIFLNFCIEKSNDSGNANSTAYKVVGNPKPLVAPAIPPCEDKFFVKLPCFDFVWSGNESQTVERIVRAIRKNNPGRPIPESKVKSFRTTGEADEWLSNNRMRVPGALHFAEINASVISYGLQTNSTPVAKRGQFEDSTLKFQIPLQVAADAEREISRSLIGDRNFRWTVELKEFPHPAMETPESISTIAVVGPTFFLAIAMFSFVFQIGSLVSEKELKPRRVLNSNRLN